MADEIGVGGAFSSLFTGTIGIMFWVMVIILGFAVVGGIIWWFFGYKKKFDIHVKIQSLRTGDPRIFFDKGAILYDKTDKSYYLRLLNSKAEIELPKFNVLYHTNKGDYMELLRKSERDFRFLTPAHIRKDVMVTKNGKTIPVGQMEQRQIENDVAWIIARAKRNKQIINPETILGILLQHLPAIISGVLSLMVLWVALRYAPDILSEMRALRDSTNQQTQVIGSLLPLLFFTWKKKT